MKIKLFFRDIISNVILDADDDDDDYGCGREYREIVFEFNVCEFRADVHEFSLQ